MEVEVGKTGGGGTILVEGGEERRREGGEGREDDDEEEKDAHHLLLLKYSSITITPWKSQILSPEIYRLWYYKLMECGDFS